MDASKEDGLAMQMRSQDYTPENMMALMDWFAEEEEILPPMAAYAAGDKDAHAGHIGADGKPHKGHGGDGAPTAKDLAAAFKRASFDERLKAGDEAARQRGLSAKGELEGRPETRDEILHRWQTKGRAKAKPKKKSPSSSKGTPKQQHPEFDDLGFDSVEVTSEVTPEIKQIVSNRLKTVRESGAELPKSLYIGRLPQSVDPDNTTIASYSFRFDLLEINPDKLDAKREKGWFSTDNTEDIVLHELAHRAHAKRDPEKYLELFDINNDPMTVKDLSLVDRHVGRYAATHPLETVAEMYVALRRGVIYPPEVMAIYDKLGGPDWRR